MSYLEVPQNFYQMLQPDTPWHPGAEGWTKAPWVTWGNNPNLVGQPRLGVGQEPGKTSLLPLLLGVAGIVGVLVLAGGALGASAAGPRYSPRQHRANRRRMKTNPAFTKLRSGDWGIKGDGPAPRRGESLTVTKRDGSARRVTIERVVWSGDNVWIAAIASEPRGGGGGGGGGGGASGGCSRCRYIPGQRTAQIWEECDNCGAEPVYV